MTDILRDPERLADADDGMLGSLLRAGRDELGSADQLAILGTRLGFEDVVAAADDAHATAPHPKAPHLNAQLAPPPVAPASVVAPLAGTLLIKLVVGLGVAAGAAALYVNIPHSHPVLAPAVAVQTTAQSSVIATAQPSVGASTRSSLPTLVTAATRDTSVESTPIALAPSATSRIESTPSARIDPVPATAGDSEVKTLERAQDALATNPRLTLGLCEEHRRRFPSGVLAQEREVLTIDALLRTGRAAEADARAQQFGKKYQNSSHLSRIEALLNKKY